MKRWFNLVIYLCVSIYGAFTQAQELVDVVLVEEQAMSFDNTMTTSVRCPGGGIAIGGEFVASRGDVSLIEETAVDCEGSACRAWQMTFASESTEPFDVKVNADCRGVDMDKISNMDMKERLLLKYPNLRKE